MQFAFAKSKSQIVKFFATTTHFFDVILLPSRHTSAHCLSFVRLSTDGKYIEEIASRHTKLWNWISVWTWSDIELNVRRRAKRTEKTRIERRHKNVQHDWDGRGRQVWHMTKLYGKNILKSKSLWCKYIRHILSHKESGQGWWWWRWCVTQMNKMNYTKNLREYRDKIDRQSACLAREQIINNAFHRIKLDI